MNTRRLRKMVKVKKSYSGDTSLALAVVQPEDFKFHILHLVRPPVEHELTHLSKIKKYYYGDNTSNLVRPRGY